MARRIFLCKAVKSHYVTFGQQNASLTHHGTWNPINSNFDSIQFNSLTFQSLRPIIVHPPLRPQPEPGAVFPHGHLLAARPSNTTKPSHPLLDRRHVHWSDGVAECVAEGVDVKRRRRRVAAAAAAQVGEEERGGPRGGEAEDHAREVGRHVRGNEGGIGERAAVVIRDFGGGHWGGKNENRKKSTPMHQSGRRRTCWLPVRSDSHFRSKG